MENIIGYYYNLKATDFKRVGNYYTFFCNGDFYLLVPSIRSKEEMKEVFQTILELKQKKIFSHEIILNKDGSYETNGYCLLKHIGYENQEINLEQILKYSKVLSLNEISKKKYRNQWATLWSEKLDYYEYQMSKLNVDKNIISITFGYFLGLAENAITLVNRINKFFHFSPTDNVCLSHRRIFFPNYRINYMNPLSFIFDLEVRDVAEYIKSSFFKGEDAFKLLEQYISNNKLTPYSINMLLARLLFPSYYFDEYEVYILGTDKDESKLLDLVDKADNYECFLSRVIKYLRSYAYIPEIKWIEKK